MVEKGVEAAGKHDLERDPEDGDSPGGACSWSRLQGDQNLDPGASPVEPDAMLEVLPGKSRPKSLEEEWRSTESKLLELQLEVFSH